MKCPSSSASLQNNRANENLYYSASRLCDFRMPCSDPDDVAASHIEANVPNSNVFDTYMKRDLGAYFCKGTEDCRTEYSLLREGPTQTGIAYPKYYVWAKCFHGDELSTQGAVRVAAIDKETFRITDFLSQEEILASPRQVSSIFSSQLVEKILKRARYQNEFEFVGKSACLTNTTRCNDDSQLISGTRSFLRLNVSKEI
jgi:hypothetical protein